LQKNDIHFRQILAAILYGEISALRGEKTYYFEGGMGRISPNILVEKNTGQCLPPFSVLNTSINSNIEKGA
jgi:hypothetical protein